MLFLDLDHFKEINDTFDHTVGDRFLKDVATNIISCVRATDTVSRYGGDEFVVLLTEIENRKDADRVFRPVFRYTVAGRKQGVCS